MLKVIAAAMQYRECNQDPHKCLHAAVYAILNTHVAA